MKFQRNVYFYEQDLKSGTIHIRSKTTTVQGKTGTAGSAGTITRIAERSRHND